MMRRISMAAAFMFAVIFVVAAQGEPIQRIHEIQRPLLSAPVFVIPGNSIEVTLKTGGKTPVGAKLRSLDGAESALALEPAAVESAAGAEEGITISPLVSAGTAEGLYDLVVDFSDGSSDTQPHSVKVLNEFKKDFDFVHITDIHFNVERLDGRDMNRIRRRLLRDISEQNPEFVVFSGDLGLYPETYDVDYKYGYEEFVEQLEVPIQIVPGNHELYADEKGEESIDGKLYWDAAYGPAYHSFDYGSLHVVGINTFDWEKRFRLRGDEEMVFFGTVINAYIGPEQWGWLVDDLKAASAAEKDIIAYTHIPINTLQGGRKIGFKNPEKMKGPDPDKFVALMNRFGVSHIFIGHMHYNRVEEFGGLKEVMTQAAGIGGDDEGVLWGYRIVHVKDGKVAGWDIHEIGFKDLE